MLRLAILFTAVSLLQSAAPPSTAVISGRVVDRQGGEIPGATVTLQGPSSADTRKVVSGAGGIYRFDTLAAGTYTLRFELTGFIVYTSPRLVLAAGQARTLNVAIEVGQLADPPLHVIGAAPAPPEPTFDLTEGEVAGGIDTSLGTFHIAVDTKRAPITASNFLKYVDAGLYEWGRFHRATRADNYTPSPNRPMMNIIQGGINPGKRSEGFPPIPLERTSVTGIKHVTGVVSMARGTAADTATSDFFVLLDDQPSLDFGGLRFDDGQGGGAFGRVLSGLDVVRKIQQQPVEGQNLASPVTIRRTWRLGK